MTNAERYSQERMDANDRRFNDAELARAAQRNPNLGYCDNEEHATCSHTKHADCLNWRSDSQVIDALIAHHISSR